MTRRKDDTELARTDTIDLIRTVVRLKHRIAQRHELNEIESEYMAKFDAAIASGQQWELDASSVLRDIDGEDQA
jgi:hypothetical protein